MGLVTRLSPPERLIDDAREVATELAQASPGTVAALKQALREGVDMPLEEGLKLEARLAALQLN